MCSKNACWKILIGIGTLIIITLVVFMVAGPAIVLTINPGTHSIYMYINYKEASCILSNPILLDTKDRPGKCADPDYVPIWKSSDIKYSTSDKYLVTNGYPTNDGYSIIINPYVGYADRVVATNVLKSYKLNSSMTCMCDSTKTNEKYIYPNVDYNYECIIFTRCFLDVYSIQYYQYRLYLSNLGYKMMYIGYVGIFIAIVISFIGNYIIGK